MAQKIVQLPGIGEVTLIKRRGSSNLRLSVTADGKVRVGMPQWSPYAAGIMFAQKRQDWIHAQLIKHPKTEFYNWDLFGKAHRLQYTQLSTSDDKILSRLSNTTIDIRSSLNLDNKLVQTKIKQMAEKALKSESEALLVSRLDQLAKQNGFSYREVKIRKLTSRWGSCSNTKLITLSYYLIQLPWQLIDYVILHELSHTIHLNHSSVFWAEVEKHVPKYKQLRKEIKHYKPTILPNASKTVT